MEISLRPKALKEAKLEQILNGVGYPYHNEATRSEIGNGVLELFIRDWKLESYTFDLHKSDKPRPKGGFQLEATENVMIVTFVLNNNYPFGMDGLLDNLADMFLQPEDLGLSHFIIGKDAVTRVMKSKKKNGPEKWSTSFNTFGCRVNSMLHEHDTAVLKYKFLPIKPLNNDEQVIVTINKENINFRGVAQSNLVSCFMKTTLRDRD
jgi:hypothetical protein